MKWINPCKNYIIKLIQEPSTWQGFVDLYFGIRLLTDDMYSFHSAIKDITCLLLINGAIRALFLNSKNKVIKNTVIAMQTGVDDAKKDITNNSL